MLKLCFLSSVFFLTAWLILPTLYAQPQINGNLSGTLGPGEYIVVGNCNVLENTSLTIEPGTTFLHNGHHTWNISGKLTAEATAAEPIIFKRQYENEDHNWGGIRFDSSSADSSVLDHCEIDYCDNPWSSPNHNGGGIYVSGCSPTIRNTLVKNCYATSGGGVFVWNDGEPVFDGCILKDNSAGNGGGFYIYESNNAVIKNCIITKNSSTGTGS